MFNKYEYVTFENDEVLEYLRKSRSDDPLKTVEEVLQHHEEILDEYAEKNLGGKVPAKNIFREIVSGETIDDRPEMLKLLKAIESPAVKAVLVVEVQRLSRGDLEDAGRLIKLLRYTNTQVITPQKTFDLNNEYDRDAFERELKRGNEYLEYTKKILYRGKLSAVRDGNYIATYAPYGYRKVQYKEGRNKCSTLEPVAEEVPVINMIFDLYVNKGYGFSRIANVLNELHVKPRVNDHWTSGSLKEIITNEVYIGKVRWLSRKTVRVVEDQEVIKTRPRNKVEDYLIFEGKHKGIVDEELFYKAKEKRSKNVPIGNNKNIRNPLAGIFYCKKCGRAMKLRQGDTVNKPRYECSDMKYCNNGSVLMEDILPKIYDVLENCIEDFEIKLKENNADELENQQNIIINLEKRLIQLDEKELNLWEKYSEDGMPKAVFEKLKDKVDLEKKEIQGALCLARDTMPEPIKYEEIILSFKSALETLKDVGVSIELKNKYLKEIIERIDFERPRPIRLTKALAKELDVDYPHRLCWHNYPFEINVQLRV